MEGNILKSKNEVPVYENMWELVNGDVHLIGSMCEDCCEVYFPQKEVNLCANCQGEKINKKDLGNEGKIHSFTIVHQQPSGGYYKGTVPFIYAIVEMPAGVHVQTHVTNIEFEEINVGQKVRAILETLYEDENTKTITYKFEPYVMEGD